MASKSSTLTSFFLGIMSWSFGEYALHNWYGHRQKGKNHFSREHLKHHALKDYFAPTPQKIIAGIPATALTAAVSTPLAGRKNGLAFTAGFASMYTAYEIIHRQLHVSPPRNEYGKWARKNHFAHHFNNPRMNHGVTSPIWDVVFGTSEPADVVRVPERFAMDWLCEPGTTEVRPEYAADYKLIPSRKRKEQEAAEVAASDEPARDDLEAAYAGEAPAD